MRVRGPRPWSPEARAPPPATLSHRLTGQWPLALQCGRRGRAHPVTPSCWLRRAFPSTGPWPVPLCGTRQSPGGAGGQSGSQNGVRSGGVEPLTMASPGSQQFPPPQMGHEMWAPPLHPGKQGTGTPICSGQGLPSEAQDEVGTASESVQGGRMRNLGKFQNLSSTAHPLCHTC